MSVSTDVRDVAISLLRQLNGVLDIIPDAYYPQPLHVLHGSSIGQHVRHILEFFECLQRGLPEGRVNYDLRERDRDLEQVKRPASAKIRGLQRFLENLKEDQPLHFEVSYDREDAEPVSMASSLFREVSSNIEHAVHHMALIKIGVGSMDGELELPADFGVAISTLRHQDA